MASRAAACVFVAILALQQLAAAAVVNSAAWNDDTKAYYQLNVNANFGSLRFVNIFVNTDVDGSTGFGDDKYSNGGDKLIQCGFASAPSCTMYTYSGVAPGTNTWGWTSPTAPASITVSAGVVTVSVARSALGETASCTESSTVVYMAELDGLDDQYGPLLTHIYSPKSTCSGTTPRTRAALPARAPRASVTLSMVYSSGLPAATRVAYIDSTSGGTAVAGADGSISADYRITGATIAKWTGSAWVNQAATATYTDSTARTTATWTVPRAAIGDPNLCSSSYTVLYAADGTNTYLSARSTANVAGSSRPAVPAYIYPYASTTTYTAATNTLSPADSQTPFYQTLYSKMPTTTTLVVLNPNSGPVVPNNSPNTQLFRQHTKVMTDMKSNYPSKSRLLMYVKTGDGARAIAAVQADVDAYYKYYNNFTNANIRIDGIFLDETNVPDCAAAKVSYYKAIVAYIRTRAAASFTARGITGAAAPFVVLNPGTVMPECYIAKTGANAIVTFESTQSSYNSGGFSLIGWEYRYPTNRVWHLVHNTPATATDFTKVINTAKDRGAGWVYVTNDKYTNPATDNPWDTMPSQTLWNAHNAAAIGSGCTAA